MKMFIPLVTQLLILLAHAPWSQAASTQNGEEARWLVQKSMWATLSTAGEGGLKSIVTSIAESDGRIFFYLNEQDTFKASITLSETQVDPNQYFGARCGPEGTLDPEDPRCAKLSINGVISPCDEDSKQLALDTLFAAHPQMADWPDDHGFIPCELKINEEDGLWMIANFGGGGYMDAADYYDSEPVHHPVKNFGGNRSLEGSSHSCYIMASHECVCIDDKCGADACSSAAGVWTDMCPDQCDCTPSSSAVSTNKSGGEHGSGMVGGDHGHGNGSGGGHHYEASNHHSGSGQVTNTNTLLPRPNFGDDAAGHARWIAAKSLWTTISTISSKSGYATFGNIRSVVDGACFLSSTGLPYFYIPSPDPTAIDIKEDNSITLSFTEAALAERVGEDGTPCEGKDAEDPTCAKLTLIGHAKPLDDDQIELAKTAFAAQHPRASWLANGGAHTGGNYYTVHLHEIMLLRSYGGFTTVTPEEYLNWKPDPSKLPGEKSCEMKHDHHHSGPKKDQNNGNKEENGSIAQPQAHSTPPSTTSSFSFFAIALVIFASFVGSFIGGLSAETVNASLRNRRTAYAAASIEDNSLALEVRKAEAC